MSTINGNELFQKQFNNIKSFSSVLFVRVQLCIQHTNDTLIDYFIRLIEAIISLAHYIEVRMQYERLY